MIDWYSQPRYRPFTLAHDDPGERSGMLMVHGFTGTPDEMRPSAEIAHRIGFDVEVMHLPGMGPDIGRLRETGRREWEDAVHERWADITARYRRRVLLGYSLGAALAILAAVGRPADALILMSPLVRLADPRIFLLPIAQRAMPWMAPFKGMDFNDPRTREFFGDTMSGVDLDDPEVQRAIREEFVMPTRLINDCRLVGREAGRRASDVRGPATVFQGRPDGVVGHRNARWLVDQLGGEATYHEIEGNHLIPFDTVKSWPVLRPLLEQTFADIHERLTA